METEIKRGGGRLVGERLFCLLTPSPFMPITQAKALPRQRFVSSVFIHQPGQVFQHTKNSSFFSNRVRRRFGSISSNQVNQTAQQDMLVVRSLLDQNGVRTFFFFFSKKNVTSLLVSQNHSQSLLG